MPEVFIVAFYKCDNLAAQTSDAFKEAVSSQKGVVWFLPKNAIDIAQLVDAGYAQILKVLTCQAQEKWLENDDNADKWFNPELGFTAKERRILITQWVGDAYNELLGPKYDNLRKRCFEKTCCNMTADGSEDKLITQEGLGNYVVPPPMLLIDPSENQPIYQPADGVHDIDSCNEEEEEEEEESPTEAVEDSAENLRRLCR